MFFEILCQTGHGSARSNTKNDGIHVVVHLFHKFRSGCANMSCRIIRVSKLIDKISVWSFISDGFCEVLVILWMTFGNIGSSQNNFCSHSFEVEYFFLAHFIGDHQNQLVTFLCCNQCQSNSGISRCSFN